MIKKWAADVGSQGIGLVASLLMRSAIKPLLAFDERSLLAVGLSHADVIDCLSTPFTTDPTELLASRGKRLGQAEAPDDGLRAPIGPPGLARKDVVSRTTPVQQ